MNNKKGFTLIELLVVVLIIGVLSAVALPQYARAVERARVAEVETIMADLRRGYKLYNVANPQKKAVSGGVVAATLRIVTLQDLMKAGGFEYPVNADGKIVTKNFVVNQPEIYLKAHYAGCTGMFSATRNDGSYAVYFDINSSKCCQGLTDSGKETCNGLGSGWEVRNDSNWGEIADLYVSDTVLERNP